ncbi:MAG TPA: hypothetical protein VIH90_00505 [Candidatus Saccharimonadales bacterium]
MFEVIGLNEANDGNFVTGLACQKVREVLVDIDENGQQRVTPKGRQILMGVGFIEKAPVECGITTTPLRDRTPDTFGPCIDCDFSIVTEEVSLES